VSEVPAPNYAERLQRVRETVSAAHVDALLISALPNVRWLTGFSGSNALVLVTVREVTLFTDFRYETQVADEVASHVRTVIVPQSLWSGVWSALEEWTVVLRIGFESPHLTHHDVQRFTERAGRWQWQGTSGLVEALREEKDASERAAIQRAIGIAERAFQRVLPQIHPGLRETQVAGLLEHELRDEGSEGFPFETIVAAGARSALPHARASSATVHPGDLLLIDYGAIADGYCADITRSVVVGSATERQREVYAVVQEANRLASAAVRPGMTGAAADAIARDYIERSGYGGQFGHSLGHGIGLEVHEAPRLAKTSDADLSVHAVVTIEPGIYLPGWGGVRIEDDVWLSPEGPVVLTSLRRDLVELC
jgi:Xaa-Pro aminopeptidase